MFASPAEPELPASAAEELDPAAEGFECHEVKSCLANDFLNASASRASADISSAVAVPHDNDKQGCSKEKVVNVDDGDDELEPVRIRVSDQSRAYIIPHFNIAAR